MPKFKKCSNCAHWDKTSKKMGTCDILGQNENFRFAYFEKGNNQNEEPFLVSTPCFGSCDEHELRQWKDIKQQER